MKKTVKLNDILSITRGASPRPISNYITNESDGVNWIKIGDVDPNSFFITHTEEKITKEGAKKSRYVKEGDFILSNSMSFGRPYILKINGCVHDGWLILSDYENHVTSSYLYYLLRSPTVQSQFDGSANGATVRNLNSDIVRNVSVSIHNNKTEQQKIAAHLDSIQSAIDNKKQQLAQFDELVKSKFVEMFGENPVENGKWKVEKLNEITDVRDGTHDSPSYYSEGYPFITTKNLIDGKIDFSTASLICKEDYEHFDKRSHVDDGDILMPMIGTIGGAVLVKKDRDFAIKNVSLIKRRIDDMNFIYLLSVLNSDFMNFHFEQFKIGGTQKFISLSLIRSLPIPVPPIDLQNDFAAYVQKIDSAKSIIKTQLNDLNELLESKMDFYFGE